MALCKPHNYKLLKHLLITLAISLSALPAYGSETELEELRQRIDDLEDLVIEMESRSGGKATANAFDAIKMNFGGYYHGVAREFDTDSGAVSGFARNILYLRIEADLAERWSVSFGNMFGQADLEQPELTSLEASPGNQFLPGYLDASAAITPANLRTEKQNNFNQILNQNRIQTLETYSLNFPIDINLKYQHNDAARFILGRQRLPIGYTSFHPTTWRNNEMPRYMLSTNGVSNLFTPFVQGLTVEGQFYPDDGQHILAYHVFTGQTTTTDADFVGAANEDQSSFRLSYSKPNQSFSLGINYIHGKREDRGFYGGERFDAVGTDLLIRTDRLRIHSEYYRSQEEGNAPSRRGYFIQPSVNFGRHFELAISHDVMDAPIYQISNPAYAGIIGAVPPQLISAIPSTVNAPSNAGKSVENTISLNYLPIDTIRLRLQYSKRVYEDLGDYAVRIAAFSATASF